MDVLEVNYAVLDNFKYQRSIKISDDSKLKAGTKYTLSLRGHNYYYCGISDGPEKRRNYKIEKILEEIKTKQNCFDYTLPINEVSLGQSEWKKVYPDYHILISPTKYVRSFKHKFVHFKVCLRENKFLSIDRIVYSKKDSLNSTL